MQRQTSLHTRHAGDIAVFNADNDDTVRQAAKAVGRGPLVLPEAARWTTACSCEERRDLMKP